MLFLDDDRNVLRSLKRTFVDDDLEIFTSLNGAEALEIIKSTDISVIVSDNLMPGMNGVEFLQQAKTACPDSVRIMLTGYVDVEAAIQAINEGEVYKFITKPWNVAELRKAILQAIDRHDVVQSLRKGDEYSLLSLAQTIELKDPYTKGHCDRVAKYAVAIAEALGGSDELKENIKRGSWLHDCGKIGVPEAIINEPGPLTREQRAIMEKHPRWGADVARLAHLPQTVVNIILYHHERYDGKGYPTGLKGDDIPLEARIVNVADIYDALTSDRSYRVQMTRNEAKRIMAANKGTYSDPRIIDTFINILGEIDGNDGAGETGRTVRR